MSDILAKRGDTFKRNIKILDSDGNAVDCTGWTIWFTVRKYIVSQAVNTDTDAIISKVFDGNSDGVFILILTSSEMDIPVGSHYYDFQVKNLNGVFSSEIGNFIVSQDVTRGR